MSNPEQVQQALRELWDIVKCRCHEAYTGRGLHDPDCECDSTDAVQTVADAIAALTEQLAAAPSSQNGQEARMSDDDLIRRGDALYAIAGWEIPSTAIAALPAVTPAPDPVHRPTMTDMMVDPDTLDAFMEANPLPDTLDPIDDTLAELTGGKDD